MLVRFFFAFFYFFSLSSLASDSLWIENRRELALQLCLDINYVKLGAYKVEYLHDHSFWVYGYSKVYSQEGILNLKEFVVAEAGNFYKENLPIKAEGASLPHTAIFARCMRFYKSTKLTGFLKKSEP